MILKDIIKALFDFSPHIRYVAIYEGQNLVFEQKQSVTQGASDSETDRFEELLVNPTLLKLAGQRGDIDCGGLDHLIVGYGNFNQLVKATANGHLSICLDLSADLNTLPKSIFEFISTQFPGLALNSARN